MAAPTARKGCRCQPCKSRRGFLRQPCNLWEPASRRQAPLTLPIVLGARQASVAAMAAPTPRKGCRCQSCSLLEPTRRRQPPTVGAGMPATGTSHPADSFGCSAGFSRCHGSSHTEKGVSMPVMQSVGADMSATATNCGSRHAGDRQRCEPADAQNPAGCPRALGSTVTFFALALAAARVMRKQLPPPATGTYSMLAWLASISCRAMYRPRPVPCSLVV